MLSARHILVEEKNALGLAGYAVCNFMCHKRIK